METVASLLGTELSLRSFWNVKSLFIVLALLNFKSLHFVWFLRFLRALIRRLTDPAPNKYLSPKCLFLPAINRSRSPAIECDYNLHKSNSTYFTDLDLSRGNFALVLFRKPFNPIPGPTHFTMLLGGVQCTWRREIKPYQPYELWTRILSWDEKWMYVVTHFVEAGAFEPEEYVMQPWKKAAKTKAMAKNKDDVEVIKAVFASAVARFVFKNNRKTVPPEQVFRDVKLLPEDEAGLILVEEARSNALPLGRMEAGWDALHACFNPHSAALGWYNSVY